MSYKHFDLKEIKKMGMGAFYGVAQGAKEPAKMIIVVPLIPFKNAYRD